MRISGIPERIKKQFAISILIAVIALAALPLISCGPRYQGYGVILMEDPEIEEMERGQLYNVLFESRMRKIVAIYLPVADTNTEVEAWRIRVFKRKKDALAFADVYAEYHSIWGEATLDRHPVRSAPDHTKDNLIYAIKQGERFKIIQPSSDIIHLVGVDSRWYEILLEDGTIGHFYDSKFDTYDENDPNRLVEETPEEDILIEKVLSRVYRPDDFQVMIRNRQIDLERFSQIYGFFPQPEENFIYLKMQDVEERFLYTDVTHIGNNRFNFVGSPLQITVKNEDFIVLHFNYMGKDVGRDFTYVPGVDDTVRTEIERRKSLYQDIIKSGTELSSTAYGKLILQGDKTFSWTGYRRLVPGVIGEAAGNDGTVSIEYLPGKALRSEYDGVLTLTFAQSGERIHFLFSKQSSSINLVHTEENQVEDNIVIRRSTSPQNIYFKIGGPVWDESAENGEGGDVEDEEHGETSEDRDAQAGENRE